MDLHNIDGKYIVHNLYSNDHANNMMYYDVSKKIGHDMSLF